MKIDMWKNFKFHWLYSQENVVTLIVYNAMPYGIKSVLINLIS